jgi:hypothetical protein
LTTITFYSSNLVMKVPFAGFLRLEARQADENVAGLEAEHVAANNNVVRRLAVPPLAFLPPFLLTLVVSLSILSIYAIPPLYRAWGTVMTLMGIVQNFHGLLVARIFLGIAEAGLLVPVHL